MFNTLSPSQNGPTDPLLKHLDKLGEALDSGNLPAAKTAFETIRKINKQATVRFSSLARAAFKTQRICRFE